jgi:hypothetical protein
MQRASDIAQACVTKPPIGATKPAKAVSKQTGETVDPKGGGGLPR